jgi:hypothetical protein
MKNKKTKIIIAISIIIVLVSVIITISAFKNKPSKEPTSSENSTEIFTEAPTLKEPINDETISYDPEDTKDVDDYVVYDYISIINKDKKIFNSTHLNELLETPEKFQDNQMSAESIKKFTDMYNSIPVMERKGSLEEFLRINAYEEIPIKYDFEYDASALTENSLIYEFRTPYSNEVSISFYKKGFKNYKEYYQVSYDLFTAVMKHIDTESLKEHVQVQKENVTISSLYEKIDEKDYDYLFNSMMNGCWVFRLYNEKEQISFGVDIVDGTGEEMFYIEVSTFFDKNPYEQSHA